MHSSWARPRHESRAWSRALEVVQYPGIRPFQTTIPRDSVPGHPRKVSRDIVATISRETFSGHRKSPFQTGYPGKVSRESFPGYRRLEWV